MAQCKSCGSEIVLIKTKTGKEIPCDAEQKYYRIGNGKTDFVTTSGEVLMGGETPYDEYSMKLDRLGHVSHFATCPQDNEHRQK